MRYCSTAVILHTVGPFESSEKKVLRSCYSTCLDLVEKHNIKSVVGLCVFQVPNRLAVVFFVVFVVFL